MIMMDRDDHDDQIKKAFGFLGIFGEIWVFFFLVRSFVKNKSFFGWNEHTPAIDRGGSQHISASIRTVWSIHG